MALGFPIDPFYHYHPHQRLLTKEREMPVIQGSRWCFTLNNYTDADIAKVTLLTLKARYLIYGFEVAPSTGTPHLQGFLVSTLSTKLSALKKVLPTAHWEQAKGTTKEAADYCKKEGNFVEEGTQPQNQETTGRQEKERWADALVACKKGKFDEVPADIQFRYYRTMKEIAKDHLVAPPVLDTIDNHWYYGDSGTGKSSTARKEHPGAYYKMCNKWWDGYQGEDVVIIEDFDISHSCLGHHLKIWGDHGPFLAETKGGVLSIRPKTVIVTSNYSIEQIWGSDSCTLDPLKRRYKSKHFDVPFVYEGPLMTLPAL